MEAPAQRSCWVRDDRLSAAVTAMIWTMVVLAIVPSDFVGYAHPHPAEWPAGHALNQLLWIALLAAGAILTVWRAGLSNLVVRHLNPMFLVFLLLAVGSMGWSASNGATGMRLFRLTVMLLTAFSLVLTAWHPRRFQNAVRPILTAMLLLSIGFGLAFPHLAIHEEPNPELIGAWHGLAMQKNQFGALASLGAILWFHGWLSREIRTPVALAGGGIALLCIVLSRSSTSIIDTVFSFAFLLMLMRSPPWMRRYLPYLVAAFLAFLLLYTLTILGFLPGLDFLVNPVSAATGKDNSFSGRSVIWTIIKDEIKLHPVFGAGFGAYWLGPEPQYPCYEFVLRMYFYPGSAHNGYLDVVNELGYVGLVCLIGYIIFYVRQSLQVFAFDRSQGALFLVLCFQQLIGNLSETHWFNVLSSNFLLMMLATASLARMLLEQKLHAYFGPAPQAAGRNAASGGLLAAQLS